MERTLNQAEVGEVHNRITAQLASDLGVTLRWHTCVYTVTTWWELNLWNKIYLFISFGDVLK